VTLYFQVSGFLNSTFNSAQWASIVSSTFSHFTTWCHTLLFHAFSQSNSVPSRDIVKSSISTDLSNSNENSSISADEKLLSGVKTNSQSDIPLSKEITSLFSSYDEIFIFEESTTTIGERSAVFCSPDAVAKLKNHTLY
jgi:hypothetical protein